MRLKPPWVSHCCRGTWQQGHGAIPNYLAGLFCSSYCILSSRIVAVTVVGETWLLYLFHEIVAWFSKPSMLVCSCAFVIEYIRDFDSIDMDSCNTCSPGIATVVPNLPRRVLLVRSCFRIGVQAVKERLHKRAHTIRSCMKSSMTSTRVSMLTA